jgi:hypothetical protein
MVIRKAFLGRDGRFLFDGIRDAYLVVCCTVPEIVLVELRYSKKSLLTGTRYHTSRVYRMKHTALRKAVLGRDGRFLFDGIYDHSFP